jgi:hypothetical protein
MPPLFQQILRVTPNGIKITQSYLLFSLFVYLFTLSPIRIDLKQGDAQSPLFFNFALEYTLKKAKETRERLTSNGTHYLLFYADDVTLLGENINTPQRNTEAVLDATKKNGLEVSVEKTKCMVSSRHQNAGQYHDTKMADKSSKCGQVLSPQESDLRSLLFFGAFCQRSSHIKHVTILSPFKRH